MKKKILINEYIKEENAQNNKIIKKKGLRILTYNVHYWKDCTMMKDNRNDIIKIIEKLNPDIFFVNEAIYLYDTKFPPPHCFKDYLIIKTANKEICKNKFYGNVLFIKNNKINNIISTDIIKIDEETNNEAILLSYKINSKIINCISSHLNVSDNTGNTRLNETKKIIKYIQRNNLKNIIWCGDFNCLNLKYITKKQYKYYEEDFIIRFPKLKYKQPYIVFDYLNNLNFINSFEITKHDQPRSTCWTKRMVDYMLLYKLDKNIIIKNANVYHSSASDHLPIYMDIIN